jgi:predicted glycosyltransferase
VPLLEAVHGAGSRRAAVVCSLRDILVGREEQAEHDERAVAVANRYFDAVLVHSDPRFARLEESLGPRSRLRVPVHHTGFVMPDRPAEAASVARRRQVVVSAGGGIVGEQLLRAAAEAHALLGESGLRMKLVAGPFLPERAWRSLREEARGREGLTVRRFVRDLAGEMRSSAASVSQCGYNTALDVVRSGTPALVVPFGSGREDEQRRRAERLARLGAVRVLDAREATPPRLADEIRALAAFEPARLGLDLDGARNAARIAADLASPSRRRRAS